MTHSCTKPLLASATCSTNRSSDADKVTHTCSGCGDGSVLCYSTSKEGKPTQGMGKH